MAIKKQKDDEKEKPDVEVEREEPKDNDEAIEVEVSGDDDEEEDEPEEVAAEPQLSRREKKKSWLRAKEEADAARAEAARYRQAYEQQQQQIAAHFTQQQQGQQFDQIKAEEDRLYEEQQMVFAAFQAAGGDRAAKDVLEKFDARARDIERRKMDLAVRRNGGGQQGPSPQQVAQLAQLDRLKDKYRDVLEKPEAYAWAHGERMRRIFQEGATDSEALLDEVAAEARSRFRLNGHAQPRRPAPTAATKARYSGVPARGAAPSNGAVTVQMGRAEKKLATALYPDLSPEKAYQKWANGPGQRATKAAQEKSR